MGSPAFPLSWLLAATSRRQPTKDLITVPKHPGKRRGRQRGTCSALRPRKTSRTAGARRPPPTLRVPGKRTGSARGRGLDRPTPAARSMPGQRCHGDANGPPPPSPPGGVAAPQGSGPLPALLARAVRVGGRARKPRVAKIVDATGAMGRAGSVGACPPAAPSRGRGEERKWPRRRSRSCPHVLTRQLPPQPSWRRGLPSLQRGGPGGGCPHRDAEYDTQAQKMILLPTTSAARPVFLVFSVPTT